MTGLLGAVLAGGRSSRFGSDKALALWEGQRLIDRSRALLEPWCDEVIVVGRNDDGAGVADLPRASLGPLGGIAGALDYGASHGYRCVLTISCDMPFLPDGLVEALVRRGPAYCSDAPVLGYWPSALGAQLLGWIETAPDLSVRGWARSVGALPIASPAPLANVNTPEDLLAL
ncbi:molybdenum cofactor guanylyltransferase [Sphingomonas aerophila]|jgi:molybdopterin-guanine dinucleotide biosynthesis protein A|uniref:Molybdenum cofactor guanylyltransferase n=1 Tax=Sphingomonas aerophila TaxID=1344948 RepID=A0A7W9BE91_9SPHN|nr:molybdenum cofactor guanylyltransferase [Sphingomonas aerophila]MBB5715408.1 molybdopterin-guanine dinucleotide biosynthesis protein A [Sphingomonas aerophila]